MPDASSEWVPQELAALDSVDRDLFARVDAVLFDALAEVRWTEPGAEGNPAPAVRELLVTGQFKAALERLYTLIDANNLSDSAFLALAVTNLYLNYPAAAERYASQAAKLHKLIGAGAHAQLLDEYARTMHDLVQEWQAGKKTVHGRFVNRYPTAAQLERPNAVDTFIMKGFIPEKPFITRSHVIATIGSCFTGNVSKFLRHNGFNVPMLNKEYPGNLPTTSFSDEVFNTYVLRYLFELAFGDAEPDEAGYHCINQHSKKSTVAVDDIRRTFGAADVFIITLGLAEVWFNKKTGEVYKTAKSIEEYDPDTHDFRVTTVQENRDNIDYVYRAIRRARPDAAVIFTLSPVPLSATFREMSCIVANSASKAILRVALDEFLSQHAADNNLHYFPSYELVLDCLPKPFGPDRRYVSGKAVNFVMTLFARHYVVHDARALAECEVEQGGAA